MSLRLIFAPSPNAYLEDILNEIIDQHIGHHLTDDFKIIVPDAASLEDLEHLLIRKPKLENVLIGKSILTQAQFLATLLDERESPLLPSNPYLERKILRDFHKSSSNSFIENLGLEKFRCDLNRFRKIAGLYRLSPAHEILSINTHFAETLLNLGYYDSKLGLDLLKQKPQLGSRYFKPIQHLYWLGFCDLTVELTEMIQWVQNHFPHIQMTLTLPPLERLMDAEEIRAQLLAKLTHHPQVISECRESLLPPQVILSQSSVHAVSLLLRRIYQDLQQAKEVFCLFPAAFDGKTLLTKKLNESGWITHPPFEFSLHQTPFWGKIQPLELTNFKPQDSMEAIHYQAFIKFLHDLENSGAKLSEDLLQEEIQYHHHAPQLYCAYPLFLRDFNEPGLRPRESAFMIGLSHLTPRKTYLFNLEELPDGFHLHQQKLLFQHALSLAKTETILFESELDIQGRALRGISPYFLTEPSIQTPSDEPLLPLAKFSPFFNEQLTTATVAGDMVAPFLKEKIKQELMSRPLTPTKLDYYSECHWKFFAAHLLGLKRLRTDDLEADPLTIGNYTHQFLEFVFKKIKNKKFFKKGWETLANWLEIQFNDFIAQPPLTQTPLKESAKPFFLKRCLTLARGFLLSEWQYQNATEAKYFPHLLELQFGYKGQPAVTLESKNGKKFSFRGRIDRIDVDETTKSYLILDYKTGDVQATMDLLRDNRSFQLFLYLQAAQQSLTAWSPAGALFFEGKQFTRKQGLFRESFKTPLGLPQSRSGLTDSDWENRLKQLTSSAQSLLEELSLTQFQLEPYRCKASCDFWEICRYENREKRIR